MHSLDENNNRLIEILNLMVHTWWLIYKVIGLDLTYDTYNTIWTYFPETISLWDKMCKSLDNLDFKSMVCYEEQERSLILFTSNGHGSVSVSRQRNRTEPKPNRLFKTKTKPNRLWTRSIEPNHGIKITLSLIACIVVFFCFGMHLILSLHGCLISLKCMLLCLYFLCALLCSLMHL